MKVPIHTLDGKKIDPKHATPKNRPKQANKTKKIFVGGVSQETSVDEVKAYFSQFGKVEEAVMLMDQQTKRHRGFGFVSLADEDVVDRICEIHFHTIKNKKVECKKAQPKETVTPATQLQLQKRLLLSGLGLRMPNGMVASPAGGAVLPAQLAAYNPLASVSFPLSFVPQKYFYTLFLGSSCCCRSSWRCSKSSCTDCCFWCDRCWRKTFCHLPTLFSCIKVDLNLK